VIIRGGVEAEFSTDVSLVAGAALDLPLRICPTVVLEVRPLTVTVSAFADFRPLGFWCCTLSWQIVQWQSGCEPPLLPPL
jgi:hypothetical protein